MSLPSTIHAWAASEKGSKLAPIEKKLPELKPGEVLLKVHSCGVCHSDIHLIQNDWGISSYPLVPGHEIIGEVLAISARDSRLKIGQFVGVGWQRSACGNCECCITGRDNMCEKKIPTCVNHWGGYADFHITDERYAFELPEGCHTPDYAPLLCGGITVFNPLCEFISPYRLGAPRVGVVAIGGLGHLAVRFAVKMGYEVTVFSSSENKRAEALAMGASHFVSSKDPKAITDYGPRLDLITVTADVDLPWESYVQALRADGTLCFVGVPPSNLSVHVNHLLDTRRRITGSPIGNRARMYQMLEFAKRHGIAAEIETYQIDQVNEAIERVKSGKVRYRGVLTICP